MTGHLLYTEEDVELVADAIAREWGYDSLVEVDSVQDAEGVQARTSAEFVLAALSSAGRLVPPGSEVREEYGAKVTFVDRPAHFDEWNYHTRRAAEHLIAEHAARLAENPAWRGRASLISRRVITTPWSVPDTEQEG